MNISSESDNTTLSTSGAPPLAITILFISLQQTIFLLSFGGNIIVIIIVVRYLKKRSIGNRIIVNLAITDLCTGIVTGCQVFYFVYPTLDENRITCFLRYRVVLMMTIASQCLLVVATFDRFIAIRHPHKYPKVMKAPLLNAFIAFSWLYPLMLGFLPFLEVNSKPYPKFCLYENIFPKVTYLLDSLSFYFFMFASFIMNLLILNTAWKFMKRVAPVSETVQVRQENATVKNDINLAKLWGLVVLFNSMCWAPFTTFPLGIGLGADYPVSALNVMNWLAFLGMLNSIMNPFIFAWNRRDFHKSLKKMFRCSHNANATVGINSLPLRHINLSETNLH